MGQSELLESLRTKGAHDAEAAWSAARQEAQAHGRQLAMALETRRAELAKAAETAAHSEAAEQLAAARQQARALRTAGVMELAARLRQVAAAELAALGREGGDALFEALADELPAHDWPKVRVNPAHEAAARSRFPDAVIETDESVSGGLSASAEEGRVLVDNTLEARLDAAWPELLPGLVAEVLAGPESHGTAA